MSEPVWVPLGAQPAGADELAYVQITSPVTCPGLLESSSTTVMTAPAITVDGLTPIVVEVFVPGVYFTDAPDSEAYLFDGSTSLGRVFAHPSGKVLVNKTNAFIHVARRLTPSAGAHTYSLRAQVSSGAGVQMLAGPGGVGQWNPAFIRVTRAMPFVPGTAAPPALVTALPGSPMDGDEIILTDSLTAGTYHWHLRYVAARATNKWVFIGGSQLSAEIAAQESTTSSGVFANLTTAGPSITIPVAGSYEFMWHSINQKTGSADLFVGNGIGVGDWSSAVAQAGGSAYASTAWCNPSGIAVVSAAAGAAYRMKYYQAVAGTLSCQQRRISARPIAVGG